MGAEMSLEQCYGWRNASAVCVEPGIAHIHGSLGTAHRRSNLMKLRRGTTREPYIASCFADMHATYINLGTSIPGTSHGWLCGNQIMNIRSEDESPLEPTALVPRKRHQAEAVLFLRHLAALLTFDREIWVTRVKKR